MEPSEQHRPGFMRVAFDFFGSLIKSAIIATALILFVMQATVVQGFSMEPSLSTGERLVIDKLTYEFYEPVRGDIIVIEIPDSEIPLIKRVIALPGETVEIRQNQVFVNGQLLIEPYLTDISQANYGPNVVPHEHVFVMGDNRPVSRDSRTFGPVDMYRIVGKARLRIWPPEAIGIIP